MLRRALILAPTLAVGYLACSSNGDIGTPTGAGGAAGATSTSTHEAPSATGSNATTASGMPAATGSMSGSGGSGGGVPACDMTPWPMYGHDVARTFASNGCIKGPLTTL